MLLILHPSQGSYKPYTNVHVSIATDQLGIQCKTCVYNHIWHDAWSLSTKYEQKFGDVLPFILPLGISIGLVLNCHNRIPSIYKYKHDNKNLHIPDSYLASNHDVFWSMTLCAMFLIIVPDLAMQYLMAT